VLYICLYQGIDYGLLSMPLVWKQTKSLKLVCFWSSFCWKVYFFGISHKITMKRMKTSIHQCVSAIMCRCKPSQELTSTPFYQQLAISSSSTWQVSHHFQLIYWRCDLNPLLYHLTIKSLPYWSAKGLLLLQKVVWFWSFFWKFLYTFNSLYPEKASKLKAEPRAYTKIGLPPSHPPKVYYHLTNGLIRLRWGRWR